MSHVKQYVGKRWLPWPTLFLDLGLLIWNTISANVTNNDATSSVETRSTLLALCEGNPSITGGFPNKGPVVQSFDCWTNTQVACDLRLHEAHVTSLITCLSDKTYMPEVTNYIQIKFRITKAVHDKLKTLRSQWTSSFIGSGNSMLPVGTKFTITWFASYCQLDGTIITNVIEIWKKNASENVVCKMSFCSKLKVLTG